LDAIIFIFGGGSMSQAEILLSLLRASASGSVEAFSRLYQITAPKLFATCRKILKRHDWAEDVLQESFIKIWHNASEYHSDRGSVMGWMTAITRYRAIDFLRAHKYHHKLDPLDSIDESFYGNSLENPLQQALSGDASNVLMGCINTLAQDQKQVLFMAYFHGLTHDELMKKFNVPLGTVKSWVRRGIESLKKCVTKNFDCEEKTSMP